MQFVETTSLLQSVNNLFHKVYPGSGLVALHPARDSHLCCFAPGACSRGIQAGRERKRGSQVSVRTRWCLIEANANIGEEHGDRSKCLSVNVFDPPGKEPCLLLL